MQFNNNGKMCSLRVQCLYFTSIYKKKCANLRQRCLFESDEHLFSTKTIKIGKDRYVPCVHLVTLGINYDVILSKRRQTV